jgi:flagellar M-ring protein FliF
MIESDGDSSTETILNKYDYLPNKTVQNIEHEVGAVKKDESSIAVVLNRYNVIKEETLEDQGALDDMTFDEYVDANSTSTEQEVPEDLVTLVAAATGIAENNIQIRLYDTPIFEAAEGSSFGDNVTNYLMLILTILIAGLLVFVIIKGTSPVEVTELEPELSVEDLLATTQEDEKANLEEIELGDKSETRVMIEKFVDENPEAVALLLRNWINEDWGGV